MIGAVPGRPVIQRGGTTGFAGAALGNQPAQEGGQASIPARRTAVHRHEVARPIVGRLDQASLKRVGRVQILSCRPPGIPLSAVFGDLSGDHVEGVRIGERVGHGLAASQIATCPGIFTGWCR